MIVISRSLVLAAAQDYPCNPVFLWENLVEFDNIVAGTAAAGYPASNMANPATSQEWRANNAADVYVTITVDSVVEIDALAIAKHTLGSDQATVSVEGQAVNAGPWVEIVQEQILPDDAPTIFRFEQQSLYAVRLKIQPVTSAPRIAVMYVGKLLVMSTGLWVGHAPLKYAVQINAIDGIAEDGGALGAIILGEWRESPARFRRLSPTFFREKMWPFLNVATRERRPFFFAPRPSTYPNESGFARLTNNPVPIPTAPNQIDIELQMRGAA